MTEMIQRFSQWFISRSHIQKIIILFVIIAASWIAYKSLVPSSSKPTYQTAEVTKGDIISTVSENGNISVSQTNISSPTSGILSEVYVKNGDQVIPGQQLFKIHSTATEQEKASALANFLSAQNTLNSAKAKMNSLQSALFKANQAFINDRGVANPSDQQKADPKYIQENADWLQAEADYNNQSGVIAQAQASYLNASLNYQNTQDAIITAPIAGTIANLSAMVGGTVSGTTTTSSSGNGSSTTTTTNGSSILVITDLKTLQMKVQANEIDIPNIKDDQKATITLDSYPDKTFVGKVASVDTIGTNTSGVVSYNVYITFDYAPPGVTPGMSASAVIQTNKKSNVLKIPSSSILLTNGESTVRVMKNGMITVTPVETGLVSDNETEIISGLNEGDTIVTSVASSGNRSGSNTSPFSSFGARGFGSGGAVFRTGGGGR